MIHETDFDPMASANDPGRRITSDTPQPCWIALDVAREQAFTGEILFHAEPEVRVYLDNGVVYYAERSSDPTLGRRLLDTGMIDAKQLERGTVRVGGVEHLGRLFDRDSSVDRDAVMVVTEDATETLIADLANNVIATSRSTAYRHHESGVHRWFVAPASAGQFTRPVADVALVDNSIVEELPGLPSAETGSLGDELRIEWDQPLGDAPHADRAGATGTDYGHELLDHDEAAVTIEGSPFGGRSETARADDIPVDAEHTPADPDLGVPDLGVPDLGAETVEEVADEQPALGFESLVIDLDALIAPVERSSVADMVEIRYPEPVAHDDAAAAFPDPVAPEPDDVHAGAGQAEALAEAAPADTDHHDDPAPHSEDDATVPVAERDAEIDVQEVVPAADVIVPLAEDFVIVWPDGTEEATPSAVSSEAIPGEVLLTHESGAAVEAPASSVEPSVAELAESHEAPVDSVDTVHAQTEPEEWASEPESALAAAVEVFDAPSAPAAGHSEPGIPIEPSAAPEATSATTDFPPSPEPDASIVEPSDVHVAPAAEAQPPAPSEGAPAQIDFEVPSLVLSDLPSAEGAVPDEVSSAVLRAIRAIENASTAAPIVAPIVGTEPSTPEPAHEPAAQPASEPVVAHAVEQTAEPISETASTLSADPEPAPAPLGFPPPTMATSAEVMYAAQANGATAQHDVEAQRTAEPDVGAAVPETRVASVVFVDDEDEDEPEPDRAGALRRLISSLRRR